MWCYGHMTNQVQLLHLTNSATAWASINPVLLEGEIGIEAGSLRVKIGDGVHKWSDLPYSRSTGSILTAGNGILMSDTEETDLLAIQNAVNNATEIWLHGGTSTELITDAANKIGDDKILNNTVVGLDDNGDVVFDIATSANQIISTVLRYEVIG